MVAYLVWALKSNIYVNAKLGKTNYLGYMFFNRSRPPSARIVFALSQKSLFIRLLPHCRYGVVLHRLDESEQACAVLEQAVLKDARLWPAWQLLANILPSFQAVCL